MASRIVTGSLNVAGYPGTSGGLALCAQSIQILTVLLLVCHKTLSKVDLVQILKSSLRFDQE